MGWDYLVDPPRGLRTATQLRKEFPAIEKIVVRQVRPHSRGSGDPTHVAYAIYRYQDGTKGAMVFLVDRGGGRFGYKARNESAGPYEYDFPVEWLAELSPPPPGYAAQWRQRVRDKAEGKANAHTLTSDYESLREE
jgi:hypothetical protein